MTTLAKCVYALDVDSDAGEHEHENEVRFVLNGQPVVVPAVDPTLLLVDFLRSPRIGLTGTKVGCGEGGCGACVVIVAHLDQANDQVVERSVNSCLRPVCTLDGTVVTTIEGLGSTRTGLNPIQDRVATYNGSQCGYCTPGFVMCMYGLLRNNLLPTAEQVEDRFDGNICRCTGYRPILDAMQSFVGDSDAAVKAAGPSLDRSLFSPSRTLRCTGSGYTYLKVLELADVLTLLGTYGVDQVELVNGNTSTGIYKRPVGRPHGPGRHLRGAPAQRARLLE